MKLAIFDIDGTLVEGSTERRFWRYLLKRGHQGPRQVVAYLWFLAALSGPSIGGLPQEEQGVSRRARDGARAALWLRASSPRRFFRASMRPPCSGCRATCGAAIPSCSCPERSSRSRGRSRAALAVAHVRATICRERDGRYLAAPPDVHPFGAAKLELAEQFAAEVGATLERSERLRRLEARPAPAASRRRPRRRDAGSAAARDGARQPLAHHPQPQRAARTAAVAARLHVSELTVRDEIERHAAIAPLSLAV